MQTGSSFCAWRRGGGLYEKEEILKKILKNKWFSVWMDLSETISSVYTPAVGTLRAWTTWPVDSGGDGALWVTSVRKWFPIRKGGSEGGGGAVIHVAEPLGRLGWCTETPAQHVLHQWAISMLLVERDEKKIYLSCSSDQYMWGIYKLSETLFYTLQSVNDQITKHEQALDIFEIHFEWVHNFF